MNISKALSSKRIVISISFSLFMFIISPVNSAIYKWVDADGNVHYGQQQPQNASSSEKLNIDAHAPNDTSSYKRPGSKSEETDEKANGTPDANKKETEKPAPKTETAAEKKRRLAACTQARKSLATMQSKGRVRSTDKDGNLTYLSQEQKEAKMKQLRDAVKKQCSK